MDAKHHDHYLPAVYYYFAGNDLSRWRAIEGQRISHCTCGEGTILKITPSQNLQRPPTLWVRFDQPGESPRWGWTNRREFSLTAL